MPPDTFAEFLQRAFDDCMKTDESMLLYEVYILFLFTQILREVMSHLAIQDNSPYFNVLNEKQTHLILTITQLAAPLAFNFKFNSALPHADNWTPVSTPSRTRTWISWPDIADDTAKQYSDEGKKHWCEIPRNFEENNFLGDQTKAPANHPLWSTDFARAQGRPLRRRPDIRSFPFSSTNHPFTTAQADLLFSLITTLDGITLPDEWETAFNNDPPQTSWRLKDDSIQGLLQDAASGIIDFWRHLARKGSRSNTTASVGLISLTTLVRYLNGDLQSHMRSHKEWWDKMLVAGKDKTKSRLLIPNPKTILLTLKMTPRRGNKITQNSSILSSALHPLLALLPPFHFATQVPRAH